MMTVLVILVGVGAALILACVWHVGDKSGARAKGERLKRMQESPSWRKGKNRFGNALSRVDGSFIEMSGKYFFGGSNHRQPKAPITPNPLETSDFDPSPESGLRVTWFGHSSFHVEIEGLNVLVDPVWGERASPFTFAGPKRFYEPPIALSDLPQIDVVLISHDHYDHLDRHTVSQLKSNALKWFVPLGVGAHLEHWGVPATHITEFDWWDEQTIDGVRLVAVPARHFSGRSVFFTDQNATLWAGWALVGHRRRLFYSGDTALHPEFKTIGDRLGPFDITLMETGAYNQLWCDVHLGPEQAVIAHQMVRGNVMIPIHWGTFDLALHGWTEPAERAIEAARVMDVPIAVLAPGEQFDSGAVPVVNRWWPAKPWDQVSDSPAWSTSVDAFQQRYRNRRTTP